MALRVSVEPAIEPITTAEGRAHLRQDLRDDDMAIDAAIRAARAYAENYTRRKFITQTVELIQTGFGSGLVSLQTGRIQSIESIEYLDGLAATQVLAASEYQLVRSCQPWAVAPSYGKTWPVTLSYYDSVTITFVAGYGDDPEDVPQDIRQAILLLLGHFYENRSDEVTGTIVSSHVLRSQDLLKPYRIYF